MRIKEQFKNTKKVLVFNPSFIGDAILTTPLVSALTKLLPEAEVDLCVRPESAPLFEKIESFNTIIYDKRNRQKGLFAMYAFARLLKQADYDMAFFLHKSLRSTAIMKLSGIKYNIGFRQAAISLLYDCKVSRDMLLHEVERNLEMLKCVCDGYSLDKAKQLSGKPATYLDEKYAANIKTYINAASGKPVIGLNPGSTWPTKMWPAEYFIELAKKLHNSGYSVLILGGPGDKKATDAVKSALDFEYYDFAAKIPFEWIPAVISNLTLLITNDSSPLHIAVSQNTPVVSIFGPTVKELGFFPYDDKSIVCENEGLYCRPCGLHGGKKCPEGHFRCMKEVTPEIVYNAVKKVLS